MRLLVAARGSEPNDWAWGIEGELVYTADVHDDLREHCICGCTVAFVGLASGKATTAARVVELDMTREQLEQVIADHWAHRDDVADLADDMLDVADPFPAGILVRRHLETVEAR